MRPHNVTIDDAGPELGGPDLAAPTAGDDRYFLGDEVARGSMGRVRRAYDARLTRPVAVKELIALDPHQRARFAREARITARLQHPAIVPVYDLGTLDSGEPFYCMKLVAGRSLDAAIAATAPGQRLALVPRLLAIVDALAYAHGQRIIHRDLKPLNVLLGEFGETIVIDWGLAKSLDEPDDDPGVVTGTGAHAAKLTAHGAVVGTPAYMPPEQAAGRPVDERADVYALGALLYHVLAGRPPYAGTDTQRVLADVLAGPPTPARALVGVPRDLAAIVDQAMSRDPAARYPTARAMADDLRRFTDGGLVGAHRYSWSALLARWLRRHRAAVTVGAILLAALAVTGTVSVQRVIGSRDRLQVTAGALRGRERELILLQAQGVVGTDPTAAMAWLRRYAAGDGPAPAGPARDVAEDALGRGVARHVLALSGTAIGLAFVGDGPQLVTISRDGAVVMWDVDTGRGRELGRDAPARFATFGDHGRRIASHDGTGDVRLRDLATGAAWTIHTGDTALMSLALSTDGRWLATGAVSGMVRLWDLRAGAPTARTITQHGWRASSLAFSGDGRWLLSGASDGGLHAHSLVTGASRELVGHVKEVHRIRFLADGSAVTVSEDRTVRRWDLATGTSGVLGVHDDWIPDVAIAPGGAGLATASGDRTVRRWTDPAAAAVILRGHGDTVRALAYAPDGRLVSASEDGTVRLWDDHGVEEAVLASDGRELNLLAVADDGRVAAAGGDQVRVWQRLPTRVRVLRGHEAPVTAVAWTPDGHHVVSGARDRAVLRWDAGGGPPRVLGHHDGWVLSLGFAGDRVVSSSVDAQLTLWDLAGKAAPVPGPAGGSWLPLVSPDQHHVAYATYDWQIHVRDVRTGADVHVGGHTGSLLGLAFFPDGRRLASVGKDGTARVWDLARGGGLVLAGGPGEPSGVAVSPDGRWIAATGDTDQVWLWDAATGQPRALASPVTGTHKPRFTADGRHLLFVDFAGTIHLHDLGGGPRRAVPGPIEDVHALALSPDDEQVATAGPNGVIRVCRLASGACARLHGHAGIVTELAFAPDGARLLSGGDDHTVRVWELAGAWSGPTPAQPLGPWLDAHTTAVIEPGGSPRTPR